MNTAAQRRKTAEQRFMEKVVKTAEDCWQWTGTIGDGGYGQFWLKGRTVSAHRTAYTWWVGPIPVGLQIDHLCRNRRCVNPVHLEVVTCRENLMRGSTLQARNAAKTHCYKGHPLSGDNLQTRSRDGARICRACRREWEARRRKTHPRGLEDHDRTCEVCGGPFRTKRYAVTRTCSKPCADRLCSLTKRGLSP